LEVDDFLEIRPLKEVATRIEGRSRNFSLMGVCFTSRVEWQKGHVLLIDYFIPTERESVKLKLSVVWSELIDHQHGYFCGGEIVHVEEGKENIFAAYYLQKLKENFF